jgi:hypothetical protein
MTATASLSPVARAPAHLWIVGALSLVWNAFGCFDYLMTNMRVSSYIARFAPDMIDFLDAFPGWLVLGWAFEVGCALLGSLLLLRRSHWAAHAFAVSVLLMAASQAYQIAVGLPPSMTASGYWSMIAVIWAVALGLLAYALRMRAAGILR